MSWLCEFLNFVNRSIRTSVMAHGRLGGGMPIETGSWCSWVMWLPVRQGLSIGYIHIGCEFDCSKLKSPKIKLKMLNSGLVQKVDLTWPFMTFDDLLVTWPWPDLDLTLTWPWPNVNFKSVLPWLNFVSTRTWWTLDSIPPPLALSYFSSMNALKHH